MCNCNKGARWRVTYPNGKTVIFSSETSAKVAKAKVAGATMAKVAK